MVTITSYMFNALYLHQKCSMANSCAHRTKMITTVKQKTCGRNTNSLKCSLIMHISGKFIATAAYLHPRCLIRAAALIFFTLKQLQRLLKDGAYFFICTCITVRRFIEGGAY